jgi:Zn-dependent protease with chaperone function
VTTSGTAVFFDGRTSRRQDVHVRVGDALELTRPDGSALDAWPLAKLRAVASQPGAMRLACDGGPELARLDVRDPALAEAIRTAAPSLHARRAAEAGGARRIVLWTFAAVISISLFGVYGVPALADRLTPLLPWSVDQRMGRAADSQIRAIFPAEPGGFACGEGSQERPGRAALDRLARKLSDAAGLPVPVEIVAVRSDFVNALALPGGVIYLFDGLIRRARSGDEIAGVLAHEIGHVANRDGTRRALQAGGVSLLFGFILGDFVGGTAAVAIVRVLSEASYSRAAETEADAYSVRVMRALGGDPRAVGDLLSRLGGDDDEPDETAPADPPDGEPDASRRSGAEAIGGWLDSHPATADRRRAIDAAAGDGPASPVMDAADLLALKRICGPRP